MTLHFSMEPLSVMRPEMEPLMKTHWQEVCHDQQFFQLDPNWEAFQHLEDNGMLISLAARTSTDELAGYVVYVLSPMLHYRQRRVAHEDAHYLLPVYRRGWTAVKMFRCAEECLRQAGVHVTIVHTKAGLDRGPVFQRLGYEKLETLYIKRL